MRSQEIIVRKKLAGAVIGLALVATACGSDGSDATSNTDAPAATDAPVATEAPAGTEAPVATEAPAEASDDALRVVSLSPTHTEIMFAIDAGDMLVAVDGFSNFPAEALELPNELSGFEPNVEAIASYEPDLVLIGGDFTGLGDQLDAIGIASWDGPAAASFDDTYAQIEQLGAATGKVGEAAELVLSMQTRLDELAAAAPAPEAPLSYFHELGPELFSSTSSTFIGEVYGIFGLVNVVDELEADAGQYPQVNAEFLVDANPDLIFLADTKCCGESAETVAARPGWESIAAVQNGAVIELDDDIASRWGPRVVDFVEVVAAAVEMAAVPA